MLREDPAWIDRRSCARGPRPAGESQAFWASSSQAATTRILKATAAFPPLRARLRLSLGAYPEKALSEAQASSKTNPGDPFFLELKGNPARSGKPEGPSAAPRSDARARDQPRFAGELGHALIAEREAGESRRSQTGAQGSDQPRNHNPFACTIGII